MTRYPNTRSTGNTKKPFERITTEDITVPLTNGDVLTISKGFTTDFASVPRIFWPIFAPFGKDELAFIVHDYLYRNSDKNRYTRKFVDKQMLWMQDILKFSTWRNKIFYFTVRLFGWITWKKYK